MLVTFVAFEQMAVATAMPVVVRDLGDVRLYGWTFSAYVLAELVTMVIAGSWAERSGTWAPLVGAVAVFVAGLAAAGAAPSMPWLVAARAVQGAGSGVVGVAVNVLVGKAYPDSARPRMYAVMSSAWVLPSVVGPAVAGVVAEDLSWRLVFLGIAPVVVIAALVALPAVRRLERGTAREGPAGRRLFDQSGAREALTALALAAGSALVLTGAALHQVPEAAVLSAAGLVIGVPALVKVLALRGAHGRRALLGAMGAGSLACFGFFGAEAFLPLVLTTVHHISPSFAGLVLTAASLCWTAGAWAQARWIDPRGARWTSRSGISLVVLGLCAVVTLTWAATPVGIAWAAWGVAGAGMGVAYSTANVAVLRASEGAGQARAVAALQMLLTLGVALGTGLGGDSLAWFVAAGHSAATGVRAFDLAAVGALGLAMAACRLLPGPRGTVPAAALPK
ncbi:MAG: MFS transporter [Actinomycetota bacterium]|nr:MFS transporter [Actinomycetota bacterium]